VSGRRQAPVEVRDAGQPSLRMEVDRERAPAFKMEVDGAQEIGVEDRPLSYQPGLLDVARRPAVRENRERGSGRGLSRK
jgi:hypothetical protein